MRPATPFERIKLILDELNEEEFTEVAEQFSKLCDSKTEEMIRKYVEGDAQVPKERMD